MKICMVMASENNGGLEKHTRELAHELLVQGHEVSVIAPSVFLDTLNDVVERREINVKRSRHHPLLLWSLYRHLKQTNADIVHAQANKAAQMLGYLKALIKPPMIATIHNLKENSRHAFSAFEHIIAVSQTIAQGFNERQQVSVIYNGIHAPSYQHINVKKTFDLPQAYPVICAVGRLVKAKAFDVLLKAVDGLPVSLIIVGEGAEYQALSSQISQMHSKTVCKLLGHREDVHDLVHSSDALVISSRKEGFPYVFVEAVHCQARVLSTNVPVAEVLPATLTVPIDDVASLREKLTYLISQPEEWEALMQPVRAYAKETLSCVAMTQKTIEKYTAML